MLSEAPLDKVSIPPDEVLLIENVDVANVPAEIVRFPATDPVARSVLVELPVKVKLPYTGVPDTF